MAQRRRCQHQYTYGLRIQGVNDRRVLEEVVEKALKGAALWDEVKDRLKDNALGLSGGQQQRLVSSAPSP